jgi:fructose/tagatose bisphosphate aldolase
VRKVNVGSILKKAFFGALREACARVGPNYNPYDICGSGGASDVFMTARIAMRDVVEDMMRLFGSAGKA